MNKISKILLAASAVLAVFSCQKQEPEKYIQFQTDSYTFDFKGSERYAIPVYSNCDWTAVSDADWIGIIERVSDTLYITAKENTDPECRQGTVTFKSDVLENKFNVEQLGAQFRGKFYDFGDLTGNVPVSKNGRYAAGLRRIGNQSRRYNPVVIDLETGVEVVSDEVNDYNTVWFISSDAKLICMGMGEAATSHLYKLENGKVGERVELNNLPDGYYKPKYTDISVDGTVVVGYCMKKDRFVRMIPVKWVNGEPIILDEPDEVISGGENDLGCIPRYASDDCNVIYGSEWNCFGLLMWVGEELTNLSVLPGFNEITEESYSGIIKTAEICGISPDGHYIAATFKNFNKGNKPCMINTETLEVTVMETDGIGMACSNDGDLFAGTPSFGGVTKAYYMNAEGTDEFAPISEWFEKNHKVSVLDDRMIRRACDEYVYGWRAFMGMTGHVIPRYFCYFPER